MFKVELAHARNPDVSGGYWTVPKDKGRKAQVVVYSLLDASQVCQAYIARNGLGGGNWTGGKVTNEQGEFVAKVSYNGRLWNQAGIAI